MAALDGVYEKIERAKIHQVDLAKRVRAVLGSDKQSFAVEPDLDSGRYAVRVFGVPAVGPTWCTIIGDCLFNLRSALDHLAWQLVILDGETPTDQHMTTFPIRKSPFDKKGNRIPMQLQPAVSNPEILGALETVQPYADVGYRPDDPVLNPLWALHRLNIIDKHRLLLVVVHTLNLRRDECPPYDPNAEIQCTSLARAFTSDKSGLNAAP